MKENGLNEKPFSSWKEIASYLGCDERTCLRWEKKHGLPVHRAGSKSSKSLVFAYKEELDEWLRRRKTGDVPSESPMEARPTVPRKRRLVWLAAIPIVLAAVWLSIGYAKKAGLVGPGKVQPFGFKIKRSELIILDNQDKELWRYDTGIASLVDNDSYQLHFPCRKGIGPGNRQLPWVKIEDIDSDGRPEVLFIVHTYDDFAEVGLFCFNDRGRKLWTYTPGREMTFGTRHFSNDYALDAVDVISTSPRGPKRILVVARHIPNFPSYIAILSPQGKTLGEYWNAGRLSDYALIDVDNDGHPALYISGTNNEYGRGFLAILEIDHLWGGSPQTEEYQCPDLKPGSELFYLLFPRTFVDRLEFAPREAIGFIDELKDKGIYAVASSSRIIYEFNRALAIDSVSISDTFREKYRKYQEEGRIAPGPLDEKALAASLAKNIMYNDGERWSMTRTFNLKNRWIFVEIEGKK